MLAGTWNIICEQGATFDWTLTWSDDNGNLINLTSYTALMQVKTSKCDDTCAEEIIELSTTNARIVLGGALGTIQLLISATDTAALSAGQYYYDLFLISGSNKYKLVKGTFTVEASVSE